MRLLSYSVLKYIRLRPFCFRLSRQLSSEATAFETDQAVLGDPSLVEVCPSWPAEEEPALREAALRGMRVLPGFVSESEERALLDELEPYLKRMRYEYDHWDNAIEGYRETERRQWTPPNAAIIQRVKDVAFRDTEPLPHQHVLDLAPAGHIKPHIDAVRFCGEVIAGLCLASSAVMRLEHPDRPHLALAALLQRRALYIMRGAARHSFTHAVCGGAGAASAWRGARMPRARRVAVICRSRPAPPDLRPTAESPVADGLM